MKIETYFTPPFTSIEEVEEAHGPIMDATTLSKISSCPRYHEIRVEENLDRRGPASLPMIAGIAVHEALDFYYAHDVRDSDVEVDAVNVMLAEWADWEVDRSIIDPKYDHLTPEALVEVLENYFHCWNHKRIEIFKPVAGLTLDSLDLSRVLAAKFKLTPSGDIILGESNLIMRFDLPRDRSLVLAGKPDLPVVRQDGSVYIMDHKTTSSYLSDWWAKSHEVSNKGRGYMAMVDSLLGTETAGFIINGIYVGKYATNPDSKATKFQRFSFDFAPDHVTEALENQWAWRETAAFYRDTLGYFPQGCGFGGCNAPDICKRDPATRAEVKATDYEPSTRTFWDL